MAEENEERDELGKAPDQEVKVWGLGVLLNKIDKTIEQNENIINLLRHIENKVEAGMSKEAEEKLVKMKRRF